MVDLSLPIAVPLAGLQMSTVVFWLEMVRRRYVWATVTRFSILNNPNAARTHQCGSSRKA